MKNGIITNTHFSDILRAALLVEHGGLWLDSTVYCTGNNIELFEKQDLFVYRNGWMDMENINMASWLMYAKSNNKILKTTLELLYKYWQKNNYLCNYFLFHMFFKMATDKFNSEWEKVPYLNQIDNHLLARELLNKYNENVFNMIIKITDFHKLTYKLEGTVDKKNTFFEKIIND